MELTFNKLKGDLMKINNSTVLVTGANRGLGRYFVENLLERGVKRIYAGTRKECSFSDDRVIPVKLDVTNHDDIKKIVAECPDINMVINNAGIMLSSPSIMPDANDSLRKEMEVNVFALHAMINAFAPVLKKNGGGGFINMLSVVSWFTSPFNATYGASKHAALSISDAARVELNSQGTQVTGVYAGFIDTDMTSHISSPKSSPLEVVSNALNGFEEGLPHVMGDERAKQVWHDIRNSPDTFYHAIQEAWNSMERSKQG